MVFIGHLDKEPYMVFIGLDWARTKHDFVALNEKGEMLRHFSFPHDAQSLHALHVEIAALEPDPQSVHVTIELHDGALLAWLLSTGYVVYGVNPKSADRAREQYCASGNKNDAFDAFVLADMARVHHQAWRPIQANSDITQSLHAWVRLRAHLTQEKTALCQRLRALLDEWCPSVSRRCGDFNRQWQQALLMDFPLHGDLAGIHGNRFNAWMKQHRLHRETKAHIQALRTEPILPIPQGRAMCLRFEIRHMAERIAHLSQQLTAIDTELEALVANHPDAGIFQTLPVKGTFTVAALLSAFGERRTNAPSWRELSSRWGAAPVTVQSGKSRHVKRRRACDHTMSQVLVFFSFKTAFTPGCWASEYYQAKRKHGVDHYAALRCLSQRWIKILHRLWTDRIHYDEALHQKNRRDHGACAA